MKLFLPALLLGAWAVGCTNPPESTMRQRQDAALNDPFNYSPYQNSNDISGGGIADFKTDAFKKDVNSVFSP